MKKIWKITSAIVLSILCISSVPVQAQEAFTIEDLNIQMVVGEDGLIKINETYKLDFQEKRHGFYRTISTEYDMDWHIDGELVKRKYYFPIKDVDCYSTTCNVDRESDGISIQLGDADKFVSGEQTYQISYAVQTKDLELDGLQFLYWNLVGNGFNTTVKNLSYTIEMPKAFDASEIYTYTGRYGEAYEKLSYQVDGNIISGSLNEPLKSYESATIKVNLDDGYFIFPDVQDFAMPIAAGTTILLIVAIILFFRYGKDDDVIVTVEFKAPDGLNSAGVGYVIDAVADQKDILSLIIEWANKGYIKIIEEKESLTLEKLKDLDSTATNYERTFFRSLFKKKDIVTEKDLKEGGTYKGLQSAKKELLVHFGKKEHRVFTSTSKSLQALTVLFIALPTFLFPIIATYMYYEVALYSLPTAILSVFMACICGGFIYLMAKRFVMKKITFIMSFVVLTVLDMFIMFIVSVTMYMYKISLIYILIYIITTIAMTLIMLFMDKRTKQGNRWLGQILGLKEFILSCEKDRLELLVHDNPSAFFDILPYAYVLGVSDVWVNKFEHIIIAAPEWYTSDRNQMFSTLIWWNYFSYNFHSLSSAATYNPNITAGSGGGSFGGGSFGGGGFSGGGFGGGGGGSW